MLGWTPTTQYKLCVLFHMRIDHGTKGPNYSYYHHWGPLLGIKEHFHHPLEPKLTGMWYKDSYVIRQWSHQQCLLRKESFVILMPLLKRDIWIHGKSVSRWIRTWSNSPVRFGLVVQHDVIHVIVIHIRERRVDGASKRINVICIALIISVQMASYIKDDSANLYYHCHQRCLPHCPQK